MVSIITNTMITRYLTDLSGFTNTNISDLKPNMRLLAAGNNSLAVLRS